MTRQEVSESPFRQLMEYEMFLCDVSMFATEQIKEQKFEFPQEAKARLWVAEMTAGELLRESYDKLIEASENYDSFKSLTEEFGKLFAEPMLHEGQIDKLLLERNIKSSCPLEIIFRAFDPTKKQK